MAEFCRDCSNKYDLPKSNYTQLCEGCGKRNERILSLGFIILILLFYGRYVQCLLQNSLTFRPEEIDKDCNLAMN